jgi:hypothetical protein
MRLCADAGKILIKAIRLCDPLAWCPSQRVKPWSDQFGSIQISVEPASAATIAPHFLDHNRSGRDLDHKRKGMLNVYALIAG